jgi:hypothetical protein
MHIQNKKELGEGGGMKEQGAWMSLHTREYEQQTQLWGKAQ